MKRIALTALFFLAAHPATGQVRGAAAPATRVEKLRAILTAQDTRASGDTLFRRFLSDPDPVVRERATIACASLQDTVLLPVLLVNLTDGPPGVREAAAFAIGQTAPFLCPSSAEGLASDIVARLLDATTARGRMTEEIGKFAPVRELNALVRRAAQRGTDADAPAIMAVARCAIRGVTSTEATSYVVDRLTSGRAPHDWRAAYALQRIGDNPATRSAIPRLVALANDPDPLVRMNLAALFGKLKDDSTLVGPLSDLAVSDGDWRVRVNCLKALGNHPPTTRLASALQTSLGDPDESVVLTALSVLGGYGGKGGDLPAHFDPLVSAVRALARGDERGSRWPLRTAAALALARIEGGKSIPDIGIPAGAEPLLAAGMIAALGETGDAAAMGSIAPHLSDPDPLFRRTALEAVRRLTERNPLNRPLLDEAYAAGIDALGSGDMAVVTTAAAILGDSLLLRRESARALSGALGALRSPADIEAVQEVCRTLAKIGDTTVAGALRRVVASGDPAAALAASSALSSLTGEPPSLPAPNLAGSFRTDFDFAYLESLPDTITVRLRTGKGDVLMELYRDVAPFTIMSILKLAEGRGFYQGLIFHRVVPNFVIQGGDPRGDGWGGPGYSVRSEFSALSYVTGTVGIASAGKDTEGSQFFITHSPQPHLDGRYTIIGRVVKGMDVVDRIQVGDRIQDLARSGR